MQPDAKRRWDPGGDLSVNSPYLYHKISYAQALMDTSVEMAVHDSRMDLDSHANMPVVGDQAIIISELNINRQNSTCKHF